MQRDRGPRPRVTYGGRVYVVRSARVEIPDLNALPRFDALIWLNRHVYPTGYSRVAPNPLAGLGGAIQLGVR